MSKIFELIDLLVVIADAPKRARSKLAHASGITE
jgi:hypothetical protein